MSQVSLELLSSLSGGKESYSIGKALGFIKGGA